MSVREFLDDVKYKETPCLRLGAQSEEQGEQELSEGAPLFCGLQMRCELLHPVPVACPSLW